MDTDERVAKPTLLVYFWAEKLEMSQGDKINIMVNEKGQ